MARTELIDHYIEQVSSGSIPFDQVRSNLQKDGIEEEALDPIIRFIDNEVQKRAIIQSQSRSASQFIFLGIVMAFIGFIITMSSFFGLFSAGNTFMIVIAYGPVFGGLAILFAGLRRRNKDHLLRIGRHNSVVSRHQGSGRAFRRK